MRRLAPWLLVLVLAALLACGRDGGAGDPPAPRGAAVAARVVRVVDGDTAVVALSASGRRERVRYIGIDTPEDVRPGTPVQCFSRRAARRNAKLVAGRRVTLRFDVERRDRYGRLLAYVHRGRVFVNARLVAEGYARPYPYPPNTAHAAELAALARRAAARGLGLWSRC